MSFSFAVMWTYSSVFAVISGRRKSSCMIKKPALSRTKQEYLDSWHSGYVSVSNLWKNKRKIFMWPWIAGFHVLSFCIKRLSRYRTLLSCVGSDGLARASLEKAVRPHTRHQFSARYLAFIKYLSTPFRNSPMKILSIRLVVWQKHLSIMLGRAGLENIWLSVMVHGPCYTRTVRHEL